MRRRYSVHYTSSDGSRESKGHTFSTLYRRGKMSPMDYLRLSESITDRLEEGKPTVTTSVIEIASGG